MDAGTDRLQHAVWVASPFVEQVGLFERWVAVHGRLPLWDTGDRLEKSMWRWVSGCRQRRIDGRLDVEIEERLAVLPGWSWVPSRGPRAVAKQRRGGRRSAVRLDDSLIAELVEWIGLNGRVPGYGKAGTREARMAAAARRLRKAKQAGRLPAEQVAVLSAVPGWWWSVSPPVSLWADRDRLADALDEFVEVHDRLPRSTSSSPRERALAAAATRVRQDHRRGVLSSGMVERFERVDGWAWNPMAGRRPAGGTPEVRGNSLGVAWKLRCEDLVEFIRETGRYPDWRSKALSERSLAVWLQKARTDRRDGRLDAGLVAYISERLPEWAESRSLVRGDRVGPLVEWWTLHGRAPSQVSESAVERRMVRYVDELRRWYSAGELPSVDVDRLAGLPGWVWGDRRDDRWDRTYAEVAAYMRAFRPLPRRLSVWATSQRQRRKAGRLRRDRVAALERLPGWVWAERSPSTPGARVSPPVRQGEPKRRISRFMDSARMLARWVEDHGRLPGFGDDAELHEWLMVQRHRYHAGTIGAKGVAVLESIAGWEWGPAPSSSPSIAEPWEVKAGRCERWVAEHDRLPKRVPPSPARTAAQEVESTLAVWLAVNRTAISKGRLTDAARVARVEAIVAAASGRTGGRGLVAGDG